MLGTPRTPRRKCTPPSPPGHCEVRGRFPAHLFAGAVPGRFPAHLFPALQGRARLRSLFRNCSCSTLPLGLRGRADGGRPLRPVGCVGRGCGIDMLGDEEGVRPALDGDSDGPGAHRDDDEVRWPAWQPHASIRVLFALTPGGVHDLGLQGAGLGRKRDRESEAASGAAGPGDREGAAPCLQNLGDSPGGTPVGTPGLVPQKKPRLTFGGGLRAISASQALEKKKLDPSSPATPGAISSASSPHPTGGDAGNAFSKIGEGEMSPLGGPAAAPDDETSLSLGAAAIEGQKADKPRLVFPAAAKMAAPGEEKPKPKLTFGGGLSGAVPLKSPAQSSATSESGEPGSKPGGSSGGLQWPAAASSSANLVGSGTSHAPSSAQPRPPMSRPQLSQVGMIVVLTQSPSCSHVPGTPARKRASVLSAACLWARLLVFWKLVCS